MKFISVFVLLMVYLSKCSSDKKKPNIIVIIADDMGFNDVGFHGGDEIPTPNIDALAYNGVILNSHYTQALCTPSRSAFLTGKYPIHIGMQHLVILEPEPWGLPLNETLLPQRLKRHGYKTHAIGKWHLGFYRKEYTPTYRGFDSHFGYWQGLQDYYDHTVHSTFSDEQGYDMRRNLMVDWDSRGKYSTDLFTEEAVKLINEHNIEDPMFMYLAHLAPHTGNDKDPLQAPDSEIAKFSHIADPERRIYAAMVSMLDQSVGKVVTALRRKHMLENSIILFISDNGAQTSGIHANHGSNYPFKGLKNSPWEGGMRCISAIWSPLIKRPQRVSNDLMHISDWLPTLYTAVGLDHSELGQINGIDLWPTISEGAPTPRTEFVYNIDDVFNYAAVRLGDFKYVVGSTYKGRYDRWFGSSGRDVLYNYDVQEVLRSPTAAALAGVLTYQQIKERHELHKETQYSHSTEESNKTLLLRHDVLLRLRQEATVLCGSAKHHEEVPTSQQCNTMQSPCLFNIREDPCERVNLASSRPMILIKLEEALMRYKKSAVPILNVPGDPRANPANWNNTWTNWGDYDITYYDEIIRLKLHPEQSLSPLAIGLIAAASVAFLIVIVTLISVQKRMSRKRPSGHCSREMVSGNGGICFTSANSEEDSKDGSCNPPTEKIYNTRSILVKESAALV